MSRYYERLTKGEGRGPALQRSQLELLSAAATAHPFYWGSFLAIGKTAALDGRVDAKRVSSPLQPKAAQLPRTPPSSRGCACQAGIRTRGQANGVIALLGTMLIALARRSRR
jgi:hypothetical protein